MKYLVAIKLKETDEREIFEFPTKEQQENFIKDIKTKYPDIQYLKTIEQGIINKNISEEQI